ncbi:hypothetical protein DFH06DRAFT_1142590 [Mycena polygramma]|nr:hypothetical protein DFH06DRAFT_1142590 [Mycena polygramma]
MFCWMLGHSNTAGKRHGRGFMAFEWRGIDTCHGVCHALAMALRIPFVLRLVRREAGAARADDESGLGLEISEAQARARDQGLKPQARAFSGLGYFGLDTYPGAPRSALLGDLSFYSPVNGIALVTLSMYQCRVLMPDVQRSFDLAPTSLDSSVSPFLRRQPTAGRIRTSPRWPNEYPKPPKAGGATRTGKCDVTCHAFRLDWGNASPDPLFFAGAAPSAVEWDVAGAGPDGWSFPPQTLTAGAWPHARRWAHCVVLALAAGPTAWSQKIVLRQDRTRDLAKTDNTGGTTTPAN